jgi:hypothetical protein
MTIMAKIAERAKIGDLRPSASPMAVAKEVTAAEWELGMPPVLKNKLPSIFLVATKERGILIN